MIIWRGWGIAGLFLIVGGIALVAGLSGHNSSNTPAGVAAVGAGMLLGGAACAALGYWLNVVRPRNKADEYLEGVRRELWQRVRAGAFRVGRFVRGEVLRHGVVEHEEGAGVFVALHMAEERGDVEAVADPVAGGGGVNLCNVA